MATTAGPTAVGTEVVVAGDAPAATATTTQVPTTTMPASAGEPGLGDDYFPTYGNGGYDVERYAIDLTWDADSESITANTTITATASRPLTTFDLDLLGLEVDGITVDGVPATFVRFDTELIIDAAADIAAGPFTVAVRYHGKPSIQATETAGGGWRRDGRGGVFILGEPEGAATWFPVNDHPSDKAFYDITVTAPVGVTVAGNGIYAPPTVDGDWATWEFHPSTPMAPYLATLVIGDYTVVDGGRSASGVPVRNVFPSNRVEEMTARFADQPAMIDALEEWFGPYPHEVYGAAVAANLRIDTALEAQTLSLFATDIAEPPDFDPLIVVHELAHQWFGDSVSLRDWRDVWLNEGFASYAEILWRESTGSTAERIDDYLGRLPGRFGADLDLPPGDPGPNRIFSPSVYKRGAMTLHALRLEVGDEDFREILTTYATEFQHANASTEEFIAIAERIAGRQLDDLFERWLYTPELPERLGDIRLR